MSEASTDQLPDGSNVVEQFRNDITELVNELLDSFYGAHSSANAFGADYDAPSGIPDGTYYVGREHGVDGGESDIGFDFLYRNFPDPEAPRRDDSEYVYGKYGWMDANDLVDETTLLRSVFESAVEGGYLEEDALEQFDAAVADFEEGLRYVREQYNLNDLAALFQSHDFDTLRRLLAHGDEESRVVWQLLHSKDKNGSIIHNDIEIPVLSETDRLMLVRTERFYWNEQKEEGKNYAYGAIIGYDDTPQRFFVHRLESDPDLQDPETDWTASFVKEKMGFDANLWKISDGEIPTGTVVRLQGDLAVIRHDYDEMLTKHTETVAESKKERLARRHIESFHDAHPQYKNTEGLRASSRAPRFTVRADTTEEIQSVQDSLGIAEATVREKQEQRGYDRLTAKRRHEIVEDICLESAISWACEKEGTTEDKIEAEARQEATEAFGDVDGQSNFVIGNHGLVASGTTRHPNRRFGDADTQAALVVPEQGHLFLIHDEHESKHLTLKHGVYEFRFLSGFEDQWWMAT